MGFPVAFGIDEAARWLLYVPLVIAGGLVLVKGAQTMNKQKWTWILAALVLLLVLLVVALVGWCLPSPSGAVPQPTQKGMEFSWVAPAPPTAEPVAVAGPRFLPTPTAGERSMVWTGTSVGDHGPYSADDWTDAWALFFLYDKATEGIIPTADSEFSGKLAVTNSPTTTLTMTNGAALVDGNLYWNLSSKTISSGLAGPGSGTNYWRVVLRKNRTAQTVRVTLLGPETGGYPALTQSASGYWDLPLYRLAITSAGAATLTDDRAWAPGPRLRSRSFLVPCTGVMSGTAYLRADGSFTGGYAGATLYDGVNLIVHSSFYVPSDYGSGLTIKPVLALDDYTTGNIYYEPVYYWSANGEDTSTHSYVPGSVAQTITAGMFELTGYSPAVNLGDYVHLSFQRSASDPLDTVGRNVYFTGWLVTYTPKY